MQITSAPRGNSETFLVHAAAMIAQRDLVPSMPPPVHPNYVARRQHRPG